MTPTAGPRLLGLLATAAAWWPRGGALDAPAWAARHRGISLWLWVHVLAIPVIAVVRGETALVALVAAGVVAPFALAAEVTRWSAAVRTASATLGLLMSTAVLVYLFDGSIEAHFHFFVVVSAVALYQTWLSFLLALAFVLLHHGVVGTLAPAATYNHAAAIANPWLWGALHAGAILGQSIACLVYWHANEQAALRERQVLLVAEKAHRDLIEAQKLSGIGSWEWDVPSDSVSWSDGLYDLTGRDRATYAPGVSDFLDSVVHPDDQDRVTALLETSLRDGSPLDYECRMLRADGEVRIIHSLGHGATDADGALRHMRGTIHDITERSRLQDEITQMAFRDPLTGLANRRLFMERLRDALLAGDARNSPSAVLFLDLDGFKAVNDRRGHPAGDALLREVATRLTASVRETDTVARIGGDEFAILCVGADRQVALLAAQRIEEQLGRPTVIEGQEVAVAASIGIAVAGEGHDAGADDLLRRADAAMYEAKTLRR